MPVGHIAITVAKVTLDTSVLDSLSAGMPQKADAAVAKACANMEADIKSLIQSQGIIDTGDLLNSIGFRQKSLTNYIVSDGVEYGIYQELGTRRGIIARPFFVPGIEKNAEVLVKNLVGVFSK